MDPVTRDELISLLQRNPTSQPDDAAVVRLPDGVLDLWSSNAPIPDDVAVVYSRLAAAKEDFDLRLATDGDLATWSRSQQRDEETARLRGDASYEAEQARSDVYAAERRRRGWGW